MSALLNALQKVKQASFELILLGDETRQKILLRLAEKLKNNYALILQENRKDCEVVPLEDPQYDRLLLTEERLISITKDLENVANLPSPLNKIIEDKTRPNGLHLQKVVVPLGVVAVIYESRPNVTVDVFALCFKTGNACVLKGGKEAQYSNAIFVQLIQEVLKEYSINPNVLYLLPPKREATKELLTARNFIDVCIPRGSQALIDFVRENAKIPVIETGAGIVHTYFDKSGDIEKGRLIINNAKTRRVSVCNALDTLIIHQECLKNAYSLVELLANSNVEIFADTLSYNELSSQYPIHLLHRALEEDFGKEFLSYKMAIKTVSCIEEAVEHIQQHSSSHSEAIIAKDKKAIDYFLKHVDAAAVYVNSSTAFTDGAEFGLGAEIGISTQKLHARGPMSLFELTSYKWLVFGDGQIRG